MKKILYVMLDWGWIKQRPHFIAEMLSLDYKVDVVYRKANRVKKKDLPNKASGENKNLSLTGFRYIPFSAIPFIRNFNIEFLNNWNIHRQLLKFGGYDYVWITDPTQIEYIKPFIGKTTKLVYDCMDDAMEFPQNKNNPVLCKRILNDEKFILKSASIIFCSAEYLKTKILKRAGSKRDDVIIVNNALELPSESDTDPIPDSIKEKIANIKHYSNPLIYVGTIDEWFDFDSILYALNNNSNITVILFGPLRTSMPKHERLKYMGTVDRKYLFNIMPLAFALIMPFKLNELIKSVNPVKLYEYIYTGKPIIATKYGETEKFSDFLNLYSTPEDMVQIIQEIGENTIQKDYLKKCRTYVENNTWKERYKIVKSALQTLD